MSTPDDAEILAGEVVPAASSEEVIRAADMVAEAEKYARERQLERVDSLHELRLFVDAIEEELRPLAVTADNVAERARLGQLASLVVEGLVGQWLRAFVGQGAAPIRDVGHVRSDRQLPDWFAATPEARSKRGIRCRRIAQIGMSELWRLYQAAVEANTPLTHRMVEDQWRKQFPDEAAKARARGRKPAENHAAVGSLSEDAQRIHTSLRRMRIAPNEALRRVTLLDRDTALLRGAMIALGLERGN